MVSVFARLGPLVQEIGLVDVLLPFVLVFTIIFAVMQKTKILGDKKNFNVVIALVLALTFVVPHITGGYSAGFDPVSIMNEALPSISLVAVAAIMLLVLLGIFGKRFAGAFSPFIALISVGFVVYIFGAAFNIWNSPSNLFSWWSPELTELLVIIAVFGVIVWFITKEQGQQGIAKTLKKGWSSIGELVEDIGNK